MDIPVLRRSGLVVVVVLVLVAVGGLGWWLVSPLFISSPVQEEFPLAGSAIVPPNMTRAEVEQIMEDAAKVNQEMSEEMPTSTPSVEKIRTGAFHDADSFHKGSGQASIYRLPDGSYVLRLENFRVTNGPDLHVILSPHPNPESQADVKAQGYVDLGKLKGNVGNQNYDIPADVDVSEQNSVVIYCKPFHVIFSVAPIQNAI